MSFRKEVYSKIDSVMDRWQKMHSASEHRIHKLEVSSASEVQIRRFLEQRISTLETFVGIFRRPSMPPTAFSPPPTGLTPPEDTTEVSNA